MFDLTKDQVLAVAAVFGILMAPTPAHPQTAGPVAQTAPAPPRSTPSGEVEAFLGEWDGTCTFQASPGRTVGYKLVLRAAKTVSGKMTAIHSETGSFNFKDGSVDGSALKIKYKGGARQTWMNFEGSALKFDAQTGSSEWIGCRFARAATQPDAGPKK